MIKQPVVREILRDFFRIMSHGIYFSSHAILKMSDEILFSTDEIVEISEKFEKKTEKIKKKSEKTEEYSLVSKFADRKKKSLCAYNRCFFPRRRKNLAILGLSL